ncbi:Rad52/Rad22 family DNA repair protein [Fibrella aquatilis]|uniref:DNA repair protein Rad52 n=1 Tax=Fibrella aquatilis TaxID=2817059 RepID=A0A939GAV7_9BACT|nr:Rad52/Rad22 family DNA repair protein [Fibrella aquatilis]MBO0934175.1 DNA repair protein Rad52 [Fibrella aquatilis]
MEQAANTLEKLTLPIQPDEMEWRVQMQTKTGKLIVVPYITNRCVMDRFDKQFGWQGWQNEISEIQGGFFCKITVTIPGEEGKPATILSKMDGASRTDIEPVKGGISDAMKRCAVQFGLGRDLYNYPRVFIDTPDKFIPDWAHQQLEMLVKKINDGSYKGGEIVTLRASYQKA